MTKARHGATDQTATPIFQKQTKDVLLRVLRASAVQKHCQPCDEPSPPAMLLRMSVSAMTFFIL